MHASANSRGRMNRRSIRNAAMLVATSLTASLEAPRLMHQPLSAAAVELTGVSSAIDDATSHLIPKPKTSYVGFDTNIYPGDNAMDAWKRSGAYDWVGYYLSAPCHKDDSWSGKRARLTKSGWGLAVIYVGQQTWGQSLAPVTKQRVVTTKTVRL